MADVQHGKAEDRASTKVDWQAKLEETVNGNERDSVIADSSEDETIEAPAAPVHHRENTISDTGDNAGGVVGGVAKASQRRRSYVAQAG